MKIKNLNKIIFFLMIAISVFLLGSCTKDQKSNQTPSTNQSQSNEQNKAKRFNNPDAIKKEQYIFSNLDTILVEHEDYYEFQNICLAKTTQYNYDFSMFDNVKVGDTITIPNGEFKVRDITYLKDSDETHIELENDYFRQYVILLNKSKSVAFIGAGEYVQFEIVEVGNLRFSKDCIYNKIINDEFEYKKITLAEAIEGGEYQLYENELFLYINDLDENKDIIEVSDVFIP